MSRKHHSEPTDHPTHPTKDPNEVTQGQVDKNNADEAGRQSRDDKLVEIGRAMQTPGRMTGSKD